MIGDHSSSSGGSSAGGNVMTAASIVNAVAQSAGRSTPVESMIQVGGNPNPAIVVKEERRSLRSSAEPVDKDKIGGGDENKDTSDLLYRSFVTVEEKLRQAESLLGDIDTLWGEEEEDTKWCPYPSLHDEKTFAEKFVGLGNNVGAYGEILHLSCSEAGDHEMSRRVKKSRSNDGSISIKSFVQPRAPRGVPLLISPVGQSNDRYIGSVEGAGRDSGGSNNNSQQIYSVENLDLPPMLVKSENHAIERCNLISLIRNATTRHKNLKVSCAEWQKLADTSEASIARSRQIYDSTSHVHNSEIKMIYQRLVDTGLTKPTSSSVAFLNSNGSGADIVGVGTATMLGSVVGQGRDKSAKGTFVTKKGGNAKVKSR